MKPSEFAEASKVYTGPGMDDLPAAHTPDGVVISVWEPTVEERIAIAEGGRVEIALITGGEQPPMAVNVYGVSGYIERPKILVVGGG